MRALIIAIVALVLTMAASAETSTYVFVSDQSELVQTGGIAHVHWTYSVEGDFELTIDPNAGTASFTRVDANATDDSPFKRALDPNQVFNMTSLVGTVLEDGTIKFTGKASDGSDILITVALTDDLAHLVGHTTPPPHSADFFIFELDAVAQRKYGGGTGEPNDPYQIATADDLMLLGESPEDYDKHFILAADIDLDPNLPGRKVFDRAVIAPDTDDTEYWFQGTPFEGVFDGNGHVISSIHIQGAGYVGLFGELDYPAKIFNLGVESVDVNGTGRSVGGLVGSNGDWDSGGGILTNCYSTGTVTGYEDVGGLVGYNRGSITMSHSAATVSGADDDVGGLVGMNNFGSIVTSYSTGAVSGTSDVGGLVGVDSHGHLLDCYSTGTVSGDENVGGLLGYSEWARGPGEVTNCYSTGTVSGDENVGGLVGENFYGSITTSFWDIQTSGETNMCGAQVERRPVCDDSFGLTTAEMRTASTFLEAGWDFINVWGIGENQTYPYLRKYSAADINQDETVDFGDLAILAENWLAGIVP